ncbi:hypothetical protein GBQ45_03420 [Mycobacterium avium subsp. hominissuis]|uniref:hypothetical protein n=1 Tax=Mycobacterium avium complex (MAC) TaxID=120793 RepID=UPI00044E523D|nr:MULTISPECIES: hypothetical protein [Mycobacterium avium complex (MAC)]ETZ58006.1 hypothetical protein L841_5488 [Mycobacterium sp. MAC_080597_8934]ETZ76521.1 hypothetical protein L840_0299 [Mycobacterium sp. MAC_011194_8550]MBZ4513795.1 hypothetical protein [Mycobacterium avium subsp. hominissuis]MBZ4562505.1 hypothetical protein [Mycobacterium avium subsp. hominissuis]
MRRRLDRSPDPDLDQVASIAVGVAEKIRDDDRRLLFDQLTDLCRWHPAKAAQLIMTFAAWFDLDVPVQALWARVHDITGDVTRGAA